MPPDAAKHLSSLLLSQHTLDTLHRHFGYSLEGVLTECELATCQAIIEAARQRNAAAIAGYDEYKRERPIEIGEYGA